MEQGRTLQELLDAASVASGFSVEDIRSRSRRETLPFVRYMLSALLYEYYHWGTTRIGHALNRDHASVLTGIRKYHDIMDGGGGRGYHIETVINENFYSLLAMPDKERRIRRYMNDIRNIIRDLPEGKRNAISNKLDRISLELKKDRPRNRVKSRRCAM